MREIDEIAARSRAATTEGAPDGPERPAQGIPGSAPMSAYAASLGRSAGAKECDDCGLEYPGSAYYTFATYECRTSNHKGEAFPHLGCTGNLCPRCAGPDLEPDRPGDPRRPRS